MWNRLRSWLYRGFQRCILGSLLLSGLMLRPGDPAAFHQPWLLSTDRGWPMGCSSWSTSTASLLILMALISCTGFIFYSVFCWSTLIDLQRDCPGNSMPCSPRPSYITLIGHVFMYHLGWLLEQKESQRTHYLDKVFLSCTLMNLWKQIYLSEFCLYFVSSDVALLSVCHH